MKETLISVDIEADGPYPGTGAYGGYSMLSLGACHVNDLEKSFYVEIMPISLLFKPDALAVSGLDRDKLLVEGASPVSAMLDFKIWLKESCGNTRPVLASFSTWDWTFVYYYLIRFADGSPFGHSSLDMKSYLMGKYGTAWRDTNKSMIGRQRPELLAGLGPHTHNALDDAREQAQLMQRLLPSTYGA